MNRRLYRSRTDTVLGGVASGLAVYLNTDPALVRIAWAILVPLTGGAAFLAYIVGWIVVPEEPYPGAASGAPASGLTSANTGAAEGAAVAGPVGAIVGGALGTAGGALAGTTNMVTGAPVAPVYGSSTPPPSYGPCPPGQVLYRGYCYWR